MSKRNFILLIIVLILGVATAAGFLFFPTTNTSPERDDTGGTNFISQFNPFRQKPATPTNTPPEDTGEIEPFPEGTSKMKLTKVSSMPIAGFTVFQKERLVDVPAPTPVTSEIPTGNIETAKPTDIGKKIPAKVIPPPTEFMPALRYADKATGNIYQTFADKLEEKKFSTTIIPKIHEAYFGNRGDSVVMRYLKADAKTIETFAGTLPKELLGGDTTGNNEIKGSFLPNNIKDITVSPDASKIFYLFESGSASLTSSTGITLNLLNNKKTQIFDSHFTEWLSFWPSNNMISLSTKPSANIPGYMYVMDAAGKNLKKVLGGINGLTTLMSPNGKLVLYGDKNLSLNIYNTDTKNSYAVSVKTLPEKCVWGRTGDSIYCAAPKSISTGEYPDSWYQGEVSFQDQLWKVDVKTGNTTLILDPASLGEREEVDGIKLSLDEKENYLFFINKKDSFLWKLDLK